MINIQKLPKHFKYHGGSVLQISGTNGHPILGIFILAFAGIAIAIGSSLIHTKPEEISADGQKIFIGVGLFILVLGMHFGFWSSHTYIDKGRRILSHKSGLFGLGKTVIHPLSDFDTIKLGFIAGDSDSNDLFPIELVSKTTGKSSPILSQPYILKNAREEITILTDFLQWPIIDMTLGPVAHVVENNKHASEPTEKLSPPLNTQLMIKDMLGEITIGYHVPSMMGSSIVSACFPLIFILFVFWDVFLRNGLYLTAFILIWALIILLIVKKYKKPRPLLNLHINTQELTISLENKPSKLLSIKLTDIHAVSLHANEDTTRRWSNKIVIQTNTEQHEIAKALTFDDTTYIYHLIKSRL